MTYYNYTSSREAKPLPLHFTPGPIDVICDRGSESMNHVGNQRFQQILTDSLVFYSNVQVKAEKSAIIIEIVRRIHNQSGRFVKKDLLTGTYFEVGDTVAVSATEHPERRSKASHLFRQLMAKNKMKKSMKPCCESERKHPILLDNSVTTSYGIPHPLLISEKNDRKTSNSHQNVRESMSLSLLQNRDDGANLTSIHNSNSMIFPPFIQSNNHCVMNPNPSNYCRESSFNFSNSLLCDDIGKYDDFTCLCLDIDAAIASLEWPLLNHENSLDLSLHSFSSLGS